MKFKFIIPILIIMVLLIPTFVQAEPFTSWTSVSGVGWSITKFTDSIYLNRTTNGGTLSEANGWSSKTTGNGDFDVRIRIDRLAVNSTGTGTVVFAIVPDNTKDFCIINTQTDAWGFMWSNLNVLSMVRGSDCATIVTAPAHVETFLYFRIKRISNVYSFDISGDGITWSPFASTTGNIVVQYPIFGAFSTQIDFSYKGSNFFNSVETFVCRTSALTEESILLLIISGALVIIGFKYPILWILSTIAGVVSAAFIYRDICSIVIPAIVSVSFILVLVLGYYRLIEDWSSGK